MSFLDRLFRRPPKESRLAPTLNGFAPVYPQFGNSIYASDAVQQCLKCICDEIKKLNPMHIRYKNDDPVPVRGTLQDVLNNPNEFMTTSEFLEKTCWMLLLNYNAFIIPVYSVWIDKNSGVERRSYKALYPVNPSQVNFLQDQTGQTFVQFIFWNGYETTIPYSDVIHLKYNFSVSQYMGGNEMGQPDHGPLLETLRLNDELLKGVAKAMKASYSVNGILKYNTLMDDGRMEAALRKFEKQLSNSESGILPLDLKGDYTPIERKTEIVDDNLLKFLDEKILRTWGVSEAILTGAYDKEEYEAFYQKVLEPIIIEFSQALTKKLFTERERQFGNTIKLYPKDLVFMSMGQVLDMINILSPTGALYENEKRVALGLRPLPELEGKRYMSLNWIDAANADQYQVGKENVEVIDEEKTEA